MVGPAPLRDHDARACFSALLGDEKQRRDACRLYSSVSLHKSIVYSARTEDTMKSRSVARRGMLLSRAAKRRLRRFRDRL